VLIAPARSTATLRRATAIGHGMALRAICVVTSAVIGAAT